MVSKTVTTGIISPFLEFIQYASQQALHVNVQAMQVKMQAIWINMRAMQLLKASCFKMGAYM